ncbi:tetratricopeptide repeat protein [Chloroflexus sp. MS-CIW-1]|uniref:tetratricopeptide repeat protein n=1 Tax=Chloroflexus sp. MS-CIW-1 TaxID=3055768 RepID=UPI00264A1FD7|nr:tetratricopeptide repeat protein [Chloroflexus sp. MS-CIW-1]MDN5270993.1 tetratricopeptide repeat protein [Chloroflexus sp. MS-CIW-1]
MIDLRWRQRIIWAAYTLLTVVALSLALRPDPYDTLRQADTLFVAGHYRAALVTYASLTNLLSDASLRLGIVLTVRNETDLARRAFASAIQAGLRPREYQLAVLYLGNLAMREGDTAAAYRTWQTLTDCTPLLCTVRDLLLADVDLKEGRLDQAFHIYRSVAIEQLPSDWAKLTVERQTLFATLFNPTNVSITPIPQSATFADPFLQPLLPPMIGSDMLNHVLTLDSATRQQLFGQLALDMGYERLALAFFDQAEPTGEHGLAAAIYRAYTHLRLGNRQEGIEQLKQLADAHPDDVRIWSLLTAAYIYTGDLNAAVNSLQRIQASGRSDPAIALIQAKLAFAQRDFVAAADAYEQAVILAPTNERSYYLTLAARFHLDSGFERCTSGLQAAQAAVNISPNDPDALTILAGTRYYCGDLPGALQAADAALEAGAGSEARFYYGLTLSAQGDLDQGRAHLEAVADQAPASVWRQRAETVLELTGVKLPLFRNP